MKLLLPTLALASLLAWVGPELLDKGSEYDSAAQAANEQFAKEQAENRRNRAAAKICGNGAANWIDEQTLSCALHTGAGKPYLGVVK